MIKTPKLNADDVRNVFKFLKELDPEMAKQLRKELKSDLMPIANSILAKTPATTPLRGLRGRFAYNKPRATISVTPGKSQSSNNLVAIKIEGGVGLIFAERNGTRSSGKTASGVAMIRKLNSIKQVQGSSGRFIFPAYLETKSEQIDKATKILNKYFDEINAGNK